MNDFTSAAPGRVAETFSAPDDYGEGQASQLRSSLGEQLGARAGEAFMGGVRDRIRNFQYGLAAGIQPGGEFGGLDQETTAELERRQPVPEVPIADAKARLKAEGLEGHFKLPDQPSIRQPVLDLMIDHARERRDYENAVSRGPQGFWPDALGFVTEMGVGMIDPVNAAAFSIPVIGEARFGRMLASAGESLAGRAGMRAVAGAAQGGVGTALLQPADWWLHTQDGLDYTMADALRSVVMGAGMGAAFHAGFGAVGDVLARGAGRPLPGSPEDIVYRALAEAPGARPGEGSTSEGVDGIASPGLPAAEGEAETVPGIEPAAVTAARSVFQSVRDQLVAAGRPADEATQVAAVWTARQVTRAARLGRPDEVAELAAGLEIRPGGEGAGEAEGRGYDQFGGERAATADLTRLQAAQRMHAEGAAREEIWKQTGWYREPDGKWRFYLSDENTNLKPGAVDLESARLDEVIEAPDLFTAYPHLRDITVRRMDLRGKAGGHWSRGNREIAVEAKSDAGATRDTLIHEIQHAIQDFEGFAPGSSPWNRGVGLDRYMRSAGEVEARNAERWARVAQQQGLIGKRVLTPSDILERIEDLKKQKAPKPAVAKLNKDLKRAQDQQRAMGTIGGVNYVSSIEFAEELRAARASGASKDELQRLVNEYNKTKLTRDVYPWETRDRAESDIIQPPYELEERRITPIEARKRFAFEHREPIINQEAISLLYDANGDKQKVLAWLDKKLAKDLRPFERMQRQKLRDYVQEAVAEAAPASASAGKQFEQRAAAPWYYSAVERAVGAAKQAKASAEQWLGMLRNAAGVKPEEMEWLGLADWLREQKGAVTKEAIAYYVRANRIEVEEVTKGEGSHELEQARRAHDEARAEWIGFLHGGDEDTPEAVAAGERYERASEHLEQARDAHAGQETKYAKYQLPGGENYRELLLTLPAERAKPAYQVFNERLIEKYGTLSDAFARWTPEEQAEFDRVHQEASASLSASANSTYLSGHWEEPNILAHVRFSDRTIDGKKALLIEEVQSDWHQEGKRKGYRSGAVPDGWRAEQTERAWEIYDRDGNRVSTVFLSDAATPEEAVRMAAREHERIGTGQVPDAPFKTTWPELTLKRMIRYAAENGYEKLAWTPGEAQAERYDLSKQIDHLTLHAAKGEAGGTLQAYDKHGREVLTKNLRDAEKELPDIIGKEAAEKLLQQEPQDVRGSARKVKRLENADLKVGGEGMKGFYDKILPATVNKLTKKFGGKVERGEIGGYKGRSIEEIDRDIDALRDEAEKEKPLTSAHEWQDYRDAHPDWVERDNALYAERGKAQVARDSIDEPFVLHDEQVAELNRRIGEAIERGDTEDQDRLVGERFRLEAEADRQKTGSVDPQPVHSLDITPALREAATEQGFPLFQRGGASDEPQGRVTFDRDKRIIELFKTANASTGIHELGHVWLEELIADAARHDAPQGIKDDLATVLKWLGVDKPDDIGTPQHEQFARGFEQYMREGRAPSSALTAAFEKFKAWLTALYKAVTALGTPISEEMRGVFDRLLATDEEIAAAHPARMIADLPSRVREDALRASVADVTAGNAVRTGEMLTEAAKDDPRIAESLSPSSQRGGGAPAVAGVQRAEAPVGGNARSPGREGAGDFSPRAGRAGRADWNRLADARRPDDEDLAEASRAAEKTPEPESIDPAKAPTAAEAAAKEADGLLADLLPRLTDEERQMFEDALNRLDRDKAEQEQMVRDGAACLALATA